MLMLAAKRFSTCVTMFVLLACQTSVVTSPKDSVRFIDLRQFDDELSLSLHRVGSPIEVNFISLPTPNDIPPRLGKWISGVSATGGKVDVVLSEDELVARSPLALIGIAASIVKSANTLLSSQRDSNRESLLKNRDVKLHLVRDSQGTLRIVRVVFDLREKMR